jgi:hypothetical protein
MKHRACFLLAAIALIALVLDHARLEAQGIQGFIVDATDSKPIPGAQVRLLRGNTLVAKATADSMGGFLIRATKSGEHSVEVTGLGLEPTVNNVKLKTAEITEVMIRMGARPLQMKALTVEGKRRDIGHDASYAGMMVRRQREGGLLGNIVVFDRSDPEFTSSSSAQDLLQWTTLNNKCIGAVFWNGQPSLSGDWMMELNLAHVEAVEVFRDLYSAPREFRSFAAVYASTSYDRSFSGPPNWDDPAFKGLRGAGLGVSASSSRRQSVTSNCGVVSIWSRRTPNAR